MSWIHAYMTGSYIGPDGDEDCDSGWIDPSWSRTVLYDSRNDVGTLLSMNESEEDLLDHIEDLLISNLPGEYYDNGDGTFYSEDATVDITTGASWEYAIHFKRKYYDTSIHDFIEVPYVPVFPSVLTESTEDVKVFHEL